MSEKKSEDEFRSLVRTPALYPRTALEFLIRVGVAIRHLQRRVNEPGLLQIVWDSTLAQHGHPTMPKPKRHNFPPSTSTLTSRSADGQTSEMWLHFQE